MRHNQLLRVKKTGVATRRAKKDIKPRPGRLKGIEGTCGAGRKKAGKRRKGTSGLLDGTV